MKKALLVALCFVLVGFMLVNGTFALPDLDTAFADLTSWLGDVLGKPMAGGAGTAVHVDLLSDERTKNLIPGGKVSQAFHVENLGEGPVYFRLVYAVQYDDKTWNHLTINFDAEDGFIEHDWQEISVDNVPYQMKVFTYTDALVAGNKSPEVTISIAMDTAVTSEDLSRYRSDFLQVQALAIDPAPFIEKGYETAEAALNLALPLDTLNPF